MVDGWLEVCDFVPLLLGASLCEPGKKDSGWVLGSSGSHPSCKKDRGALAMMIT